VNSTGFGAKKETSPKRKRRPRVSVTVDHPKHGKIEIKHMKQLVHGESCSLMLDSAGAPNAPVWVVMAKQGKFLGHSSGPFEMNLQTFQECIRNFKANPEEIPCDFEHFSEAAASEPSIGQVGAPAQGWIKDMKIENGLLHGLVEWGDLARQYIREGKYKYVSPSLRLGCKDRVSGQPIGARISSLALTNVPFLAGLGVVKAKDADTDAPDDLDELDEDEDGDTTEDTPASAEDTQITETEKNMSDVKTLKDTEDKLAVMTDKFTLADTKAKESEKLVTAKDAEIVTLREENKGLQAWKIERETADNKAEVEVAFETYKDQRKLSDAMRDPMLAMLKAAPDAFRTMYPAVALSQRHLLRNVSATRESMPTAGTAPSLRTPDDFIALSDKIRRDTKCTREESLIEADKQFRAARRSA
jgi:phage I-like protein